MRFLHPDGTVVHLGYGTNVLPAEDGGVEVGPDPGGIDIELRQDARQVLRGMDVGPVRQVDDLTVGVPQPHHDPPRRIEFPSKVASTPSRSETSRRLDCP